MNAVKFIEKKIAEHQESINYIACHFDEIVANAASHSNTEEAREKATRDVEAIKAGLISQRNFLRLLLTQAQEAE